MADNREIVGWFFKNGRRIPIRKKSGSDKKDVIFSYGDNTGRRHAKVVDALPEKTGRFSNGYGKLGTTERDGKEYDVFSDRDRSDAFGYYAKPTRKGKEKTIRDNMFGKEGKRRHRYMLPQKKNFTGEPDEDYVKKVMKEYGLGRTDAIRFIRED